MLGIYFLIFSIKYLLTLIVPPFEEIKLQNSLYEIELLVKCEMSKYVRFLHLLNRQFIDFTFLLVKFERSREVKEEHPLNIYSKYITFSVLKFERSIEVNEEQPSNKLLFLC